MSDDPRLRALLSAIRDGDERGAVMSSESLAHDLGWSPADVAVMLSDAKAGMLVWGLRSGGNPQPHFDDIELTVQGNRYLRHHPEAT